MGFATMSGADRWTGGGAVGSSYLLCTRQQEGPGWLLGRGVVFSPKVRSYCWSAGPWIPFRRGDSVPDSYGVAYGIRTNLRMCQMAYLFQSI